ncbi:MAG: response regulator transcription factor [candidate division Zixibacteria bacterium]
MPAQRILLLEDDPNLGLIVQEHLQMAGYDVTLAVDGVNGLEEFKKGEFDLCLVDVMMPRKDGFAFAREVRQLDGKIPLIFLTAKSMKEDKIEGFKVGCDDYITKPFSVEELLLRVQALLRRSGSSGGKLKSQDQFEIGDYHFDHTRQILSIGESKQRLTPKEADLLRLLCLHMNETLERDVALREIWSDESYFTGRSMDVFISKLRKYFRDDESVQILGIHGKGFRLGVG